MGKNLVSVLIREYFFIFFFLFECDMYINLPCECKLYITEKILFLYYDCSKFSQILLPLQSAVTVKLPATVREGMEHNPFPDTQIYIQGFDDTVRSIQYCFLESLCKAAHNSTYTFTWRFESLRDYFCLNFKPIFSLWSRLLYVTVLFLFLQIEILHSLQKPKKITMIGSDGNRYVMMCKPKVSSISLDIFISQAWAETVIVRIYWNIGKWKSALI